MFGEMILSTWSRSQLFNYIWPTRHCQGLYKDSHL